MSKYLPYVNDINSDLLYNCLSAATALVIGMGAAHKHEDYVVNQILDRTFYFYTEIEKRAAVFAAKRVQRENELFAAVLASRHAAAVAEPEAESEASPEATLEAATEAEPSEAGGVAGDHLGSKE